jgi:hypothetical protein
LLLLVVVLAAIRVCPPLVRLLVDGLGRYALAERELARRMEGRLLSGNVSGSQHGRAPGHGKLRFSLRDLLLAVTAASMALGLWHYFGLVGAAFAAIECLAVLRLTGRDDHEAGRQQGPHPEGERERDPSEGHHDQLQDGPEQDCARRLGGAPEVAGREGESHPGHQREHRDRKEPFRDQRFQASPRRPAGLAVVR